MLRIIIFAVALLIDPAITAGAEMPGCSQLSDLSAARLRWAAVRKKPVNPAHNEESCRSYGSNFFDALTTRQAASFCRDSIDRQRPSNCSTPRSKPLTTSSRLSAAAKDRSRSICIRVTSFIRLGRSIAARVGGGTPWSRLSADTYLPAFGPQMPAARPLTSPPLRIPLRPTARSPVRGIA